MTKPEVMVYAVCDGGWIVDVPHYVAFLVQPGKKGSAVLPVRFSADTAQGARDAALAFWNVETAKAKAKSERGAKLAVRKSKFHMLEGRE